MQIHECEEYFNICTLLPLNRLLNFIKEPLDKNLFISFHQLLGTKQLQKSSKMSTTSKLHLASLKEIIFESCSAEILYVVYKCRKCP